MPTDRELQELERVHITLTNFREKYEDFYWKLAYIFKLARGAYKLKPVCRMIINGGIYEIEPADCYIELYWDLLNKLQQEHRIEYLEFVGFLKRCNSIGYTNICRMMLGETPEQVHKYGRYKRVEI